MLACGTQESLNGRGACEGVEASRPKLSFGGMATVSEESGTHLYREIEFFGLLTGIHP